MVEMLRVFVAAELPKPIIQAAAELQRGLKASGLRLRWVKPENIHLTLKFLGDIAVERRGQATLAIQRASQTQAEISLSVEGLGVFPSLRKPRVIWMGLTGEVASLLQLQLTLEDRFADLLFDREQRPFKAHLTLARSGRVVETQQLAQALDQMGRFQPVSFIMNELVLFQSELRPNGAIYTPLARVPLGASNSAPAAQELTC